MSPPDGQGRAVAGKAQPLGSAPEAGLSVLLTLALLTWGLGLLIQPSWPQFSHLQTIGTISWGCEE